MMASIEHVLPVAIKPLDGSNQGFFRPGLQVTDGQTGYRYSRDWFEYNLRSYAWRLARFASTGTLLKEFQAFLDHTRMGGSTCWIRETLPTFSKEMVIGPIGDGSRTTFVVPVWNQGVGSPPDAGIFADGEPVLDVAALHYIVNLLDDDQANATAATTGMNAFGTCAISRSTGLAADGNTSFVVNPTGSVDDYGIISDFVAVTGAETITFMAAVKGTGNFTLEAEWFTAVPASLGSDTATAELTAWNGWTILSLTVDTHADTTQVKLSIYKTDESDENFYVGCMAINRGDLDKWFLPSEAPAAVEFDTAPTDRQRVTAAGTFTRLSRCRYSTGRGMNWTLTSPGNARDIRFAAFEEIEK
jgi:hypothetical protein